MKTLITGATGFVGRQLVPLLQQPIITSRSPDKARRLFGEQVADVIPWDPVAAPLELDPSVEIGTVINLMGEGIDGRWSAEKKKRIETSRVIGTRHLVQGLVQRQQKPDALISTSAVGFYGTRGDEVIDENDAPGGQQQGCSTTETFLATLCQQWEEEASAAAVAGIRVALVRVGIVLGRQGGALKKMIPIFRACLGARMGSGRQYFPWIHVDDLVRLYVYLCEHPVTGPVNGTAPNPVTNREFTEQLAKKLRRPGFFSAPKFAIKLILGEFGESLFFSQRVVPRVAAEHGFQFEFADLPAALDDLLASQD